MKLALLIEYDGTEFAGWQSQTGVRTVQSELESGFEQIFGRRIVVNGAGRTDTGVHGRGMVAHVELHRDTRIDLYRLTAGLNATTGRDVVVHEIRAVPDDFNARHSASSREYSYTIRMGRTAIDRKFQWAMHYKLEKQGMRRAAQLLLGEHDFTAFSKRSEHVEHYRCIVDRAEWVDDGARWILRIRANRFVRGLVRGLVGGMVEVGRGNCSVSEFESMLSAADPLARAMYLAPARGLVLECVRYPERFGLWN